ncbi:HET-domain-containing protein, partial [Cadophora sp. DSE1049]
MRLINTETMLIEEFFGSDIPPYAILSHCWGDEEVGFQDIGRPRWQRMYGFIKIKYTCQQAKVDGFGYAWIDTCCIDKSSSAELSEAINSMYSWYSEATVCYVYLQDVIPSDSTEKSVRQLQDSRWFTRGWTLQELLASQTVKFYDSSWNIIGTKNRLHRQLSQITQIPEIILQYRTHLKSVGVAQRMSWAANRLTTRVEDMAYCLLGLFDVNMPLLYGEGDRAFIRLQEEILKVSDDQSLFAWVSPKVPPKVPPNYGVLARSPTAFQYARDIVPIPSKHETHLYSMTNKGLSIQLPMLFRGDEVIGLLDCRRKGDISSVIGIGLLR